MPAFITWDFDPTFVNILGLEVRWYGLMWALAFAAGLWIFGRIIKREKMSDKVLDSIFWYVVISCIVGARLGHCFFYEPGYYLAHPIEVLYVRDGGMASHGAALGMLIGLWLFSRKNKLPFIWSLDRIGIVVAIGGALIRLGNLFNSEIYGFETSLPWGFIFVNEGETVPKHPTQLYEALAYVVLFALLWWMYFKKDLARRKPGFMFGFFLIWLFAARFFIEFVKNPQVAFEESMALDMGQLLSIPFVIAGAVILALSLKKYKNSPIQRNRVKRLF